MKHLFLAAPLLLASTAWCAPTMPPAPKIDASLVEVTLVPEKKAMMLGEPNFLLLSVRNRSRQNWQVQVGGDYRNALGRPESFKVKVTDAQRKLVPQPDAGPTMGGLMSPQKIPSGGSFAFRLFVPDWATFSHAGGYRVQASRILQLSLDTPGADWHVNTTNVLKSASCRLEVVPRDEVKMGAVIAKLGHTMLGSDYDQSASAARTLSYIQDERVIPYFVRALNTRNYDLKFTALGALGKFKSDEALQALKVGMAMRAPDIANASTPEVAASLAENIRHAAASALARSPHPEARAFLISQRHDSSRGVRITVLHALGAMPPAQALPILREMAQDKDKSVADEARRTIALLSAKR